MGWATAVRWAVGHRRAEGGACRPLVYGRLGGGWDFCCPHRRRQEREFSAARLERLRRIGRD